MASQSTIIKKLQHAINGYGMKILFSTSQFYSEDQQRPVTCYILKQAIWDDEKHRNVNIELFKSYSQIQIVLFLRDMWYRLNGWELPTDNDTWNKIREEING